MSRTSTETPADQGPEIISSVLTPVARNHWFPTRDASPNPAPGGRLVEMTHIMRAAGDWIPTEWEDGTGDPIAALGLCANLLSLVAAAANWTIFTIPTEQRFRDRRRDLQLVAGVGSILLSTGSRHQVPWTLVQKGRDAAAVRDEVVGGGRR